MKEPKIILNAACCKLCDDFIVSEHPHDFKWCKCQSIAVDGGKDYIKRCGELIHIDERSKFEKE